MAEETTPPVSTEAAQPEPKHDGRPTLAVKVYAPFKVYFEGEAYSVSAVNGVGPFDVLPHHHKFLCMLVPCTLSIQSPAGPQAIKVARALMHVNNDRVVVFMDV